MGIRVQVNVSGLHSFHALENCTFAPEFGTWTRKTYINVCKYSTIHGKLWSIEVCITHLYNNALRCTNETWSIMYYTNLYKIFQWIINRSNSTFYILEIVLANKTFKGLIIHTSILRGLFHPQVLPNNPKWGLFPVEFQLPPELNSPLTSEVSFTLFQCQLPD